MTAQRAVSVDSFTSSIGINMNIGAYGSDADQNLAAEENALSYLDIKLVRGVLFSSNVAAYTQLNQDLGIKYDFILSGGSTSQFNTSLKMIEANPSIIAYAEGTNESDEPGWAANYNGLTGLAATAAEQEVLYNAVHSDTQLAGVGVIQATFGHTSTFATYGNQGGAADYANSHIYYNFNPWGTNPLANGGSWMNTMLADAQAVTPGAPSIVTESGYETQAGTSWAVSLTDQAKYTLDDVFDLWNAGVSKTFIFDLVDAGQSSANASSSSNGYGIYNADWTPKPAAIALHNLMTLLADPGTGGVAPSTLDYTLSGEPSSVQTSLLEKSDGTFVLSIWNDVPLQNSSGVDTPVAAVPVTLTLGSSYKSITIYDPLTGTSAIQSFSNAGTVQIMVPDHPVLIEISNASSTLAVTAATANLAATVAATNQPVISAPTTLLATPGGITQVGGIGISNNQVGNIKVQVTDSQGTLGMRDANNQALAGSGTDSITLFGPAAIVNAELATLAYYAPVTAAATGDDTISLQVTGSSGAVKTDFIAVNSIGIPALAASIGPLLSVPTIMHVATGTDSAITDAVLTDNYYAVQPGLMSLTVSAASGEVQIQSNGVELAAAQSLTVTGSYAQLVADLQTLTYLAGPAKGTDTVSFLVTDPSGQQTTASVAVTVGSQLSVTGLGAMQLVQGTSGAVNVQISNDGFKASNAATVTVTVTDSTGTLSMLNGNGSPIAGSGSHSITVSGTADQVDGYLASLVETAPASGTSDNITLTVKNAQGVTASASASVKVVPAVAITAPGSVPVGTGMVTPVSVSVTDKVAAAGGEAMTVVVSDRTGLLSITDSSGAPVTGAGGKSITLTGTLATINAELATLTYTGPAGPGSDTIAITASDVLGGSSSSSIAVPTTAVGTPPAYFWLTDTTGDTPGRQKVLSSGSMVLTTAATGLNGSVTEQVANGVVTLTANQWDKVKTVALVDGTAGNSYVLNNFATPTAVLSNGPNAAGQSQNLTINDAQNGVVTLGSGNQNVVINAGLGGAATSSQYDFTITEGSGTDSLTVNGIAGSTAVGVTAGAGTEVMNFINAHASIKAGSGNLTVYGNSSGTNVTAGTGNADITAGSGWNDFTYHNGDGLMTIEDFSARDTLIVDSSLKAGMTVKSISGGIELLFSSSPNSEILLKGATPSAPSHITWI